MEARQKTNPARMRIIVVLSLYAIAGFVYYSNVLPGYFAADDFCLVGEIHLLGYWGTNWVRGGGFFLRPVTMLFYLLDYHLWGFNPPGYHLTNVLFHTLNAFLVFLLACELFRLFGTERVAPGKRMLLAAAGGILFLVLPCHSESVAWISGRADLVAALFALISAILFCRYVREPRKRVFVAAAGAFLAALLSKESTLSLPFVFLLLLLGSRGLWWKGVETQKRRAVIGGFLILVLLEEAVLFVRYFVLGAPLEGYGQKVHLDLTWETVFEHLAGFMMRVFLPPFPKSVDTALGRENLALIGSLAVAVFGGLLIVWPILRRRARPGGEGRLSGPERRLVTFLWGSFLLLLVPVAGMSVSLVDSKGERLLYLPSVFAVLALVFSVVFLTRRSWVTILAVGALSVYGGARGREVNARWVTAGEIAKNVASSIAHRAQREHVILVNFPDNVRGAYALRNALDAAVYMFRDFRDVPKMEYIAIQEIHSIEDEVRLVERQILGGTRYLCIPDPRDEFFGFNSRSDFYRIVGLRGGVNMEFYFKPTKELCDVFYYTRGDVRKTAYRPFQGGDH